MFEFFSDFKEKYTCKAFLKDWLSVKDLSFILFPYNRSAYNSPKSSQTLNAFIELCNKKMDIDVLCQMMCGMGRHLNTAMEYRDFKEMFENLQSNHFKGIHHYKIWKARSNNPPMTSFNDISSSLLTLNDLLVETVFDINSYIQSCLMKLEPKCWARESALKLIEKAIPKLNHDEIHALIPFVLNSLTDIDHGVRFAALDTLKSIIVKFRYKDLSLFILPLLKRLRDYRHSNKASEVMSVFIQLLGSKRIPILIDAVLWHVSNSSILQQNALIALKIMSERLRPSETVSFEPFIEHIFILLYDKDGITRIAALESINTLIPHLGQDVVQRVIPILLELLHDKIDKIQEVALITMNTCIATLDITEGNDLRMSVLERVDNKHKNTDLYLNVIKIFTPHLDQQVSQAFIYPLCRQLSEPSITRIQLLHTLLTLIPFHGKKVTQPMLAPLLAMLTDDYFWLREQTLKALINSILGFEPEHVQQLIDALLAKLDKCKIVPIILVQLAATLKMALIPKLTALLLPKLTNGRISLNEVELLYGVIPLLSMSDAQQYIEPFLSYKTCGWDSSIYRRGVLILIPQLAPDLVCLFIEPFLTLHSHDTPRKCIEVFESLQVMMPALKMTDIQPLIPLLLEKFLQANSDSYGREIMLKVLWAMVAQYEPNEIEPLITPLLAELKTNGARIGCSGLKAITKIIKTLEPHKILEWVDPVLSLWGNVSWSSVIVEIMYALLSKIGSEDIVRVVNALKPGLNQNSSCNKYFNQGTRTATFNILSYIINTYPEQQFTFEELESSVEVVALINMQQMIQTLTEANMVHLQPLASLGCSQ